MNIILKIVKFISLFAYFKNIFYFSKEFLNILAFVKFFVNPEIDLKFAVETRIKIY